MNEEEAYMEYRPADYTTFEKGQQLLAMARQDRDIAKTLREGTDEEKKAIFHQAGLSEAEVEEALTAIERTFGIKLRPSVVW